MARPKSAVKQLRRSLKRNEVNSRNKSLLRTQIKSLRKAIKDKDSEKAKNLLPDTFSIIDRTIKKGAIHESTGNRFKSRLNRQVDMINPPPAK